MLVWLSGSAFSLLSAVFATRGQVALSGLFVGLCAGSVWAGVANRARDHAAALAPGAASGDDDDALTAKKKRRHRAKLSGDGRRLVGDGANPQAGDDHPAEPPAGGKDADRSSSFASSRSSSSGRASPLRILRKVPEKASVFYFL